MSGHEQTLLACEQEPVFNERLRATWGKTRLVVDPATRCTAQGAVTGAVGSPPEIAGVRSLYRVTL